MSKRIRVIGLMVMALLVLSACQPLMVDEDAMVRSDARRVQGEIFLPADFVRGLFEPSQLAVPRHLVGTVGDVEVGFERQPRGDVGLVVLDHRFEFVERFVESGFGCG